MKLFTKVKAMMLIAIIAASNGFVCAAASTPASVPSAAEVAAWGRAVERAMKWEPSEIKARQAEILKLYTLERPYLVPQEPVITRALPLERRGGRFFIDIRNIRGIDTLDLYGRSSF
jgi:hypothetical protein